MIFRILPKWFTALCVIAFLIGGACAFNNQPTKYSTQAYPDSFLAQAMEAAGIHPEGFAKRLLGVAKAEIMAGKFTREEVVAWCEEHKARIEKGVTYAVLKTAMDKFFKAAISSDDELISQAAIVTYAVFAPEIPPEILETGLLAQDMKICIDLLAYIIKGV